MTEKSTYNNFNREAMYCGTMLGLLWILTSAVYLAGLEDPIFSFIFLALLTASPFYAWHLAVRYRKRECNNNITLSGAWIFLIIMYICASLLSAVAQHIYFIYFDNGYLLGFMHEQLNLLQEQPGVDEATKILLAHTQELLGEITTKDIVMQLLTSNIMLSFVITFITALFVKRNK